MTTDKKYRISRIVNTTGSGSPMEKLIKFVDQMVSTAAFKLKNYASAAKIQTISDTIMYTVCGEIYKEYCLDYNMVARVEQSGITTEFKKQIGVFCTKYKALKKYSKKNTGKKDKNKRPIYTTGSQSSLLYEDTKIPMQHRVIVPIAKVRTILRQYSHLRCGEKPAMMLCYVVQQCLNYFFDDIQDDLEEAGRKTVTDRDIKRTQYELALNKGYGQEVLKKLQKAPSRSLRGKMEIKYDGGKNNNTTRVVHYNNTLSPTAPPKRSTSKKGTRKRSTSKKGTRKRSTSKKGTRKRSTSKKGTRKRSTSKKGTRKRSRKSTKSSTGPKKKRKPNPWIEHVRQYQASHPDLNWKQACAEAKTTYVKTPAKTKAPKTKMTRKTTTVSKTTKPKVKTKAKTVKKVTTKKKPLKKQTRRKVMIDDLFGEDLPEDDEEDEEYAPEEDSEETESD
jgi:histone H3/H4